MKTAIIITGNLRTWEHCKSSFEEIFDDSYDVFITTYDKKYNYAPFIKQWTSYNDDVIVDNNLIINMFSNINVKNITIEKDEDVDRHYQLEKPKFNKNLMWENSSEEFTKYYTQYNKLRNELQIVKEYETNNNFKYDRIIKTRFDLIYVKQQLSVDDEEVLVDSGNLFPNDCIFLSERNIFERIIDDIVDEFYEAKFLKEGGLPVAPPHGLLLNAIRRSGAQRITRKKIMKCVLRKTTTGIIEQYY